MVERRRNGNVRLLYDHLFTKIMDDFEEEELMENEIKIGSHCL